MRKTQTSTEVKQRWEAKTYKRYVLRLRMDTDAETIKRIEAERAKGLQTSEAIKRLIEGN